MSMTAIVSPTDQALMSAAERFISSSLLCTRPSLPGRNSAITPNFSTCVTRASLRARTRPTSFSRTRFNFF